MQNLNTAYGTMQKHCCLCDNLVTIMRILMAVCHGKRRIIHKQNNVHYDSYQQILSLRFNLKL